MALPMGISDEQAEPQGLDGYRVTCIDFIQDISKDYLAWVDRYELDSKEDHRRREMINSTITRTSDWIAKVSQSIRAIDVVMNDGIQKMAEATAGQPFPIGVFVNQKSFYTVAHSSIIDVVVKANGRQNRQTQLGFHFKDTRFRIESTCNAHIVESNLDTSIHDSLNISLKLDATGAKKRDVISFTTTISEIQDKMESDKRGVTTIVHIV
ncbi:MAG: hypothetical protein R1F52_05285 [Candidatus Nitrosoabyssus spongiisocia]|nr:MAG: hypothetical protein R1F52_05285 [Nitrosopumilaceae archaeon AB1(1)]